jgi:ABC-type Fe3+-siderophore transport system permease subunit
LKLIIGITSGGVFGVLLAVYVVKALPLTLLTWLVIAVIFITALTLLRAGIKGKKKLQPV